MPGQESECIIRLRITTREPPLSLLARQRGLFRRHAQEETQIARYLDERAPLEQAVRDELTRRGHKVEAKSSHIATPVMLHVDQKNGTLHGAGDPAAGRHACGI